MLAQRFRALSEPSTEEAMRTIRIKNGEQEVLMELGRRVLLEKIINAASVFVVSIGILWFLTSRFGW